MTEIIITPEQRTRAINAAIEANPIPAATLEQITTIVDAALQSLAEPEPTYPEPENKSIVKGIWADGTIDMYEHDDEKGPDDGGIKRAWRSYTWQVWLTWEMVLAELRKRGTDGVPHYEVFTPPSN